MTVEKRQSGDSEKMPVNRRVLVVGGGLSGIEAALSLSALGYDTVLVEQEDVLESCDRQLLPFCGFEHEPELLISRRTAAAKGDPRIRFLQQASILNVGGSVGDFRVGINHAGTVSQDDFAAIVVAAGFEFDVELPDTDFPHRVVTHSELEKRLSSSTDRLRAAGGVPSGIPTNVCFVVGDSGEDSAVHAASALRNALAIKKRSRSDVFVCCQNVNVSGEGLEKLYSEARSHGVVIFKFDKEPPQISSTDTGLIVTVRDSSAVAQSEQAAPIDIECDMLVLPERIRPPSNTAALQDLLEVGLDSSNYLQENNVWLKPTASNRKGVFFVGECRGSFYLDDVLTDARSTALEIHNLIRGGEASVSASRAVVVPSKCALCLTCLRSCPHGAVELVFDDTTRGKAARIIDMACDGCGLCAAECPAKAIQMTAEGSTDGTVVDRQLVETGV
jgi:heterodisulfide reductase subunit A-like polyferredoxin